MNRVRNGRRSANVAMVFGVVSLLTLIVVAVALPITLGARGASTSNVNISGFAFVPQNLLIQVGDTVIWTNNDGTPHTVTSTDLTGELDSGTISNGDTYTHVFNTVGTFSYRCELHPSMTGSVSVETIIPEFSSVPFVFLGILVLVLGLMVIRRRV